MRSDDGITEGSCGQMKVLLRLGDGAILGNFGQAMVLLRVVEVR